MIYSEVLYSDYRPMLTVTSQIQIPESELEINAIRAQGPGGQNVNKVASAIHLRFDIKASSLPEYVQHRLLLSSDYRITKDGVVVIKAQRYRTREQNLEDARNRLAILISSALVVAKPRKKTRPSKASKQRRMDQKSHRGKTKTLRSNVKQYE
jgi:ribosome-associated protein